MGSSLSATGDSLKPVGLLGDVPDNFVCAACNDTAALIITDQKQIELRTFSGETLTKTFNLRPTSVCSLRPNGWAIGFSNGFLSEFDASFELVRSYRTPGTPRAHTDEVRDVVYIDSDEGGSAHLMSYGKENVVCFWGKSGELLWSFVPRSGLIHGVCSPYFGFFADGKKQIHTVNLESFENANYPLISNVKSIVPIGDGFAALAVLENHWVCLLAPSGVVETFKFAEADMMTGILPLVVEDGTGLITYITVDSSGKLMLRALEEVTGELGEGYKLIADSPTHVLVTQDEQFAVFRRDHLAKMSIDALPEMSLPRRKIVKALERVV